MTDKSKIFEAPVSTPETTQTVEAPVVNENKNTTANIIDIIDINQTYIDDTFSIWDLFTKRNKKKSVIFDKFTYSVKDRPDEGQFLCILGKSGCGKSTLLRYISGLQMPTSGEIKVYGNSINPEKSIPMVFQQYSSFPWMTVLQNVALPLVMHGVEENEANKRALEMLKIVGLDEHEGKWAKYPNLSGGQLQRVAIARNLVANPQILLMDEPFGALDTITRREMQMFLRKIFEQPNGIDPTVVLVTHDVREAVFLATDIIILDANPATIRHEMSINLPKVRDKEVRRSSEYLAYVNEIEDVMEKIDPRRLNK